MAEFCKQCSIDTFGVDHKELAGMITKESSEEGYMKPVICEGCGIVMVDHEGKCVDPDCELHGKPNIEVH